MKTSLLMLLREIIDDYFHNHMEHTKLCEECENFFNVKCCVNTLSNVNSKVQWYKDTYRVAKRPQPDFEECRKLAINPFRLGQPPYCQSFQTVQVHYAKSIHTQKNFAISNPVTLLGNHAVLELNHVSPTF